MDILLIFVAIIWGIICLLLFLFSKKYQLVNGVCVDAKKCDNITEKEGFIFFKYEKNTRRGKSTYYGKASSVGHLRTGKECKILVTKDYDERVIVFADVLKLIIAMILFSILIFVLYISGIDIFKYLK